MKNKKFIKNSFKEEIKKEKKQRINNLTKEKKSSILLYNDDIHTFDFVIEALIEICSHLPEQAEQCMWIIHYKGKCQVKSGKRQDIYETYKELLKKGLKASIV